MEESINLKFERLVLFANDVNEKGTDPLGIGMQEHYLKFVKGSFEEFCEGKVILGSALAVLAYRSINDSELFKQQFQKLLRTNEQNGVIEIINDSLELLDKFKNK